VSLDKVELDGSIADKVELKKVSRVLVAVSLWINAKNVRGYQQLQKQLQQFTHHSGAPGVGALAVGGAKETQLGMALPWSLNKDSIFFFRLTAATAWASASSILFGTAIATFLIERGPNNAGIMPAESQ